MTGYVPMMPEYGLGFWQCKLRYWNQEQVVNVAREYRRREVPLDVIVIDFFHWKHQGEWSFDPEFWPDPGKFQTFTVSFHVGCIRKLTASRCYDSGTQGAQSRADGLHLAYR